MVEGRADSAALARECSIWSRYLVDCEPSPAVVARYGEAHAQGIVETQASVSAFDSALLRVARHGPFLAQACDVHARLFRPAGLLRRKLVLTLALLEVDRDSHARVDQVSPGSRIGMMLLAGGWSLRFALIAGLGLFVFVPLRLMCALGADPARPT